MKMTRTQPLALVAIAAVTGAIAAGDARGDSVVQFMTAKSLPDATVAVIDPESGTSSGTSGSDVNLAVGDIILFRFSVSSAPASAVRGIQSYVTEYVPPGTELVGVRITDEAGNTLEPRRAGLALDGCSGGANCNSVAGHQTGSIAQVYADTGVFYTTDPLPGSPVPVNQFLTLDNGITMSPEPRLIDPEIVQLLNDTSGTYFAHNEWDWDQAQAFGTASSAFANGGDGNTPHGYGSPVAGPDTHYSFEVTDDGTLGLDGVEGPWERIFYPGSQIGTGVGDIGSTSVMTRVGVETALGWDLTPATAVDATAVRWALGEAQVGEIRYVEVALRVTSVPIDPSFGTGGGNVDCGEAFGSDISSKSMNTGGNTNPWPSFVAHPQCVFLRLKLDLTVDKTLAGGTDTLAYTVFGKNLATSTENNARVVLKYVESDQDFLSSNPLPDAMAACPAPDNNKTCLTYNLGALAPSDEFEIDLDLVVGGTGGGTNVVTAQYLSNELTAIDPLGYSTTAMTVVQPTASPRITLSNALDVTASFAASPSTTWLVNGTVQNAGTVAWTSEDFTIVLPSATWGLRNAAGTLDNRITVGGVDVVCTSTGLERVCSRADSYAIGQSRTISFRLSVPSGLTPSLHEISIRTRGSQSVFGSFETEFHKALTVPVGAVRSERPVLTCPIVSTQTSISGTSEADAAIRLLFNLIQRGTGTASGAGAWTVNNYLPGFGEMYGGLEIRATAQAPGELRSEPSTSCIVVAARQCSDGFDNDGDGLIDFPGDPGCANLADNDETNPPAPQCSDGLDNDGANGMDWPADPSCTDPTDNTEDGQRACNDGVDNDGDGDTDFPADSDCTSILDGTEVFYRACQDGLDNDGDTFADFPADAGCHSAFDDDEFDAGASTLDTKARLLLAVDSSGSMNWNTCRDDFTGGDGSTECAGNDIACAECAVTGCSNAIADDARLFQVKSGLANVVAAFGEIEYSLMRFHQRSMPFLCPGPAAGQQSGGWQGGGVAPCSGGFAAGDLLVSFAGENEHTILDFLNHDSDYDGVAPIGTDFEIRGTGTTPLAGILTSAGTYLDDVQADDLKVACRPYGVILVTDGNETCGGNPQTAASALFADQIPVHVIGFATPDATVIANLNSIAAAGGTGGAIFVDDEAALSQAIAEIVEDSILIETCNGLDDDCDTLIDEDFPDLGDPCDNGEEGECFEAAAWSARPTDRPPCATRPTASPAPRAATASTTTVTAWSTRAWAAPAPATRCRRSATAPTTTATARSTRARCPASATRAARPSASASPAPCSASPARCRARARAAARPPRSATSRTTTATASSTRSRTSVTSSRPAARCPAGPARASARPVCAAAIPTAPTASASATSARPPTCATGSTTTATAPPTRASTSARAATTGSRATASPPASSSATAPAARPAPPPTSRRASSSAAARTRTATARSTRCSDRRSATPAAAAARARPAPSSASRARSSATAPRPARRRSATAPTTTAT